MREFDLAWQRTLHDGGWAGINWPKEFGGQGLSDIQQMIWYEEFAKADPPFTLNNSCTFVGNNHGGPTLIACGNDEQKAFHLPKILGGESVWCQGFSEPGAGSDLASLSCKAVVDGDELVVTGQKIWTSYADVADFQELLVRTDPAAPEAQGHLVGHLRHDDARHRHPADPHDGPHHRLRRGVLRRGAHPAHQRRRSDERRLAGRDVDALASSAAPRSWPTRSSWPRWSRTSSRRPGPAPGPTASARRSTTTRSPAGSPPAGPRCAALRAMTVAGISPDPAAPACPAPRAR